MKWAVLFILTLIILLPQPLFFSYTQSLDGCSVKLVESTNYALTSSGYADVNVSEAKQMIESNPDLVILDVRTLEEYESGHIENAVLIPVSELESKLNELDKVKETLVYCRSGGRSATASQILIDNEFTSVYNMLGGITAWRDEGYWIEIIHEGDLIIDGTQVYVIENCTYIQAGDIYVRDYSKLNVRNALLDIDQNYTQFNVIVDDHATLTMKNSGTKSSFWFSVSVGGFAKAQIEDSEMIDVGLIGGSGNSELSIANSTVMEIHVSDSSRIEILNSKILWTTNLHFHPPNEAYLNNLQPGYFESWNIHSNQTVKNVNYELTLRNTTIYNWGLMLDYDSLVEVSSSTISRIIQTYYDASAQIKDILPGSWINLRVGEMILDNCVVAGHWHFTFSNTDFTILNSSIHTRMVDSKGSIAKSFVDWTVFHGENVLYFNKTLWTGYIGFLHSDVYVSGDVQILSPFLSWSPESVVTRNYNLIVRNMSNIPVANVELTLFDQNDTVVWNGVSNSLGRADFNLTYTDSNCTDALRVESFKEGFYSISEDVSFLSDTPMSFLLVEKPLGDVNNDHVVNIVDVSLVACSYNSHLGEENWNIVCDLNNDEVIDILDITLVAVDYGKTV